MIDPQGQVIAAIELDELGRIDARLPKPLKSTLYSWLGDWPAIIATLLLLSLGFTRSVRKTH
jgi:apolipoprotein N-acyltransferase